MSVTNGYATKDDLANRFDLGTGGSWDAELEDALNAASRSIDRFCGRMFWKNTASASARVFTPSSPWEVEIDDVWSLSTVKTDAGGDGTFETTWASTDYETQPLNAVLAGVSGWPTTGLRAVAGRQFPLPRLQRASGTVQITAQWGWSAIPSEVRTACLILAAELFKLRDAPFGAAGFTELGIVRIRENPRVAALLSPFIKYGRNGRLVVA